MQRATAERKLEIFSDNFRPVPFSPTKTLNFAAHEKLFRALSLWDFAHLELDREVRSELLVHLIAYYDSSNRRSPSPPPLTDLELTLLVRLVASLFTKQTSKLRRSIGRRAPIREVVSPYKAVMEDLRREIKAKEVETEAYFGLFTKGKKVVSRKSARLRLP